MPPGCRLRLDPAARAGLWPPTRSWSHRTGSKADIAGGSLCPPSQSSEVPIQCYPRRFKHSQTGNIDAHADEQNRGSLARTAKALRSGNWSAKRAAPAAERCSCAVLECRLSMRFAVTSQGELTQSRGAMQHSNTGFDPKRSYALIQYGIQINGRQRSNNISHSTREDVCACGLVAPVTRNPQRR